MNRFARRAMLRKQPSKDVRLTSGASANRPSRSAVMLGRVTSSPEARLLRRLSMRAAHRGSIPIEQARSLHPKPQDHRGCPVRARPAHICIDLTFANLGLERAAF